MFTKKCERHSEPSVTINIYFIIIMNKHSDIKDYKRIALMSLHKGMRKM